MLSFEPYRGGFETEMIAKSGVLFIRESQMEAFAQPARQRLIDSAVERIFTLLPEVRDGMDRSEVEDSVRLAMSKSASYGVTDWPDVIRYLDVMYMLGFEFDQDLRYAWAPPILTGAGTAGAEKMTKLTEMALQELERAEEPGQD